MLAETTCCLAASHAAKRHGVKVGLGLPEARPLCPGIYGRAAQVVLLGDVPAWIWELVRSLFPGTVQFLDLHALERLQVLCDGL